MLRDVDDRNEQRLDELDPNFDVVDFLPSWVQADLTNCDVEPIHLSGAIQPHGALLGFDARELSVRVASANSRVHLGADPSALLGRDLVEVFGAELGERLRGVLAEPRATGVEPLTCHLPIGAPFELTWHRINGLVVTELEPAGTSGAVSTSQLYTDVRAAMDALQAARDARRLCDAIAAEIAQLTGYDRVMVYRFHGDGHGEVVAEQRAQGQEPFLGLHYPASDIPRQARKLYLLNHLRVIADVGYEPVALIGDPRGGPPEVNLSFSGLRSVSPIHLAYLTNMGVRATLTISLMEHTRLWGMLACHHRAPRRIDAQLRAACRLLGQMFSLRIVAQENEERAAYRARLATVEAQIVAHMVDAKSLAHTLSTASPSPLEVTAADGMVARIDGETVTAGVVPPPEAVDALLERLCEPEEPSSQAYDDLPQRFPELAGFAEQAAGVIAVPISAAYEDFVLWFRGEAVHDVVWAGDPNKAMIRDPGGLPPGAAGAQHLAQLAPRTSFAAWRQQVRGHCRPWRPAEIEAAKTLAISLPELLLARTRNRLVHQGLHDALTGLPNRALLLDRIDQALARQQRGGGNVALLFIDLDRFKLVNDSFGHSAGDELLRQAARRLEATIRDEDTAARIGGDEFVVLSDGVASIAEALSERIVEAFRAPFELLAGQVLVTASVGVVVGDRSATANGLLRDADTAMYRAKHSGRNSFASFTQEMQATTLRRVEIETRLRPALERDELDLFFQPVQSVEGTLTGFEALARWPLRGRGMVPPVEFIPVAEAIGLIGALTDWVLDHGCAELARWRRARPELGLTVAVNIVASQMADDRLPRMIESALSRYGLPANALCLEITESALVADDAQSQAFLRTLHEQGVWLSIDDFGTGFSSLAYLTKLPVDELKIDRSFIAGLPSSQSDVTVVAAVVGLAHELGLEALAEGVETEAQLASIRRLGCDRVQGYLLGRPVAAEAIDRVLAT